MKQFLYAMAAVMCTVSAQAGIVNYECELHSLEAQGWIPPVVLLSVDADKNARGRSMAQSALPMSLRGLMKTHQQMPSSNSREKANTDCHGALRCPQTLRANTVCPILRQSTPRRTS